MAQDANGGLLPTAGQAVREDVVDANAPAWSKCWPSYPADAYAIGQRLLRPAWHVERALKEAADSAGLVGVDHVPVLALLAACQRAGFTPDISYETSNPLLSGFARPRSTSSLATIPKCWCDIPHRPRACRGLSSAWTSVRVPLPDRKPPSVQGVRPASLGANLRDFCATLLSAYRHFATLQR